MQSKGKVNFFKNMQLRTCSWIKQFLRIYAAEMVILFRKRDEKLSSFIRVCKFAFWCYQFGVWASSASPASFFSLASAKEGSMVAVFLVDSHHYSIRCAALFLNHAEIQIFTCSDDLFLRSLGCGSLVEWSLKLLLISVICSSTFLLYITDVACCRCWTCVYLNTIFALIITTASQLSICLSLRVTNGECVVNNRPLFYRLE